MMNNDDGPLESFWIEFGPWPEEVRLLRVPPDPEQAGVSAVDLEAALRFVHDRFYPPDRELPPVVQVIEGVTIAPGLWAGGPPPRPDGQRGVWYPARDI